jgi:fructose/tagatose bisphosphate aldolase
MYSSMKDVLNSLKGVCEVTSKGVKVLDKDRMRQGTIDALVYNSVFNEDHNIHDACTWIIWESAFDMGIAPSSIQELYEARGQGKCKGFTVPAMNIRGMTYDTGRAVIRSVLKNNVGPFILEIARSEMGYTEQRPKEYTTVLLAAAVKEGYTGPMFIQGDHFQFPTKKFKENPEKETKAIKDLTLEAIEGGFYNIDIDSSTLVDLEKPSISEQQYLNYKMAAEITAFIRQNEPKGVAISVGGEIGEVGTKNSTPEDLRAFMDGYNETLKKLNSSAKGLSKISIQTGTSHGGVVLPDGTIAKVKLDFDTLKNLSELSRREYGMSGAVQHGASTLPADAFNRFPETETAEVHLATEFQNMIYDNSAFPKALKDEIYKYLHEACADEMKPGMTEEQFIYKARKKGLGKFKKQMWDMPVSSRESISKALEDKFSFLFNKLSVVNTKKLVEQFVQLVKVSKPIPESLQSALAGKDVEAAKMGKKSAAEAGYHSDEIGE